ncbi:fasciculation and elongation protein zeta-2-like isoform X2 [Lineus longissimus]|uniref:fasciculation and elongation protein zeta-2-like isoform X2 n=1 Tax=Lineus longissimus TaxID=88925 RepID=UPI00315DAC33
MMRDLKMAELDFHAPLAKFESDEWNEFHDFQTASDLENSNKDTVLMSEKRDHSGGLVDNFSETFSGSLEDLVNTFDEKITKCFCNYDEKVEKFAPVQVRSQEEIVTDCQMWWTITGNFGNILPIDWSKSYARQLQTKALNLSEKRERLSPELDLSEDEELTQAFDMHSLIISSLQQEPMFTAEEVINEIEDMMQEESPSAVNTPSDTDMLSPTSNELLHFKEKQAVTPANYEAILVLRKVVRAAQRHPGAPKQGTLKDVQKLSVGALNELLEEMECMIKEYSETLIQELALRDELEYEKELKNQFISLLLSIQKKRRECHHDKRKNIKKNAKAGNGNENSTFLTTVIPYHVNQGAPNISQLQIYIKILKAINEDSPQVPTLLTDYILKVLCPT